ncbi:hypothetical protein MTO96_034213 [Rhipicephalus appendiculatus]
MLQGVSIWRHPFAISTPYFNLLFTLYTVLFSSILRDTFVLQKISLLTDIPVLAVMSDLMMKVNMITFTSFSSGARALILCLLSWALAVEPAILR